MGTPRYLFTLSLFLVPWLAPGAVMAVEVSEAVLCEIRVTAVPGGVKLQPVASAGLSVSGTYEFVATSRADGSTSNSSQSGTFDLDADTEHVLSSTILGMSDGRSYEAHLTLWSDDQDVVCRDEYPSDE